ncbi:hypothetical protein RRG08_008039 [Elysia crispata]|uniref:Uncharacterized protein n=1 Tax=Elysia crispata TaxID=231223 RepID=A0AAE1DZD1_9GAST|nr:hypothetical protein RRG08_008039 [Elysia crispata]
MIVRRNKEASPSITFTRLVSSYNESYRLEVVRRTCQADSEQHNDPELVKKSFLDKEPALQRQSLIYFNKSLPIKVTVPYCLTVPNNDDRTRMFFLPLLLPKREEEAEGEEVESEGMRGQEEDNEVKEKK